MSLARSNNFSLCPEHLSHNVYYAKIIEMRSDKVLLAANEIFYKLTDMLYLESNSQPPASWFNFFKFFKSNKKAHKESVHPIYQFISKIDKDTQDKFFTHLAEVLKAIAPSQQFQWQQLLSAYFTFYPKHMVKFQTVNWLALTLQQIQPFKVFSDADLAKYVETCFNKALLIAENKMSSPAPLLNLYRLPPIDLKLLPASCSNPMSWLKIIGEFLQRRLIIWPFELSFDEHNLITSILKDENLIEAIVDGIIKEIQSPQHKNTLGYRILLLLPVLESSNHYERITRAILRRTPGDMVCWNESLSSRCSVLGCLYMYLENEELKSEINRRIRFQLIEHNSHLREASQNICREGKIKFTENEVAEFINFFLENADIKERLNEEWLSVLYDISDLFRNFLSISTIEAILIHLPDICLEKLSREQKLRQWDQNFLNFKKSRWDYPARHDYKLFELIKELKEDDGIFFVDLNQERLIPLINYYCNELIGESKCFGDNFCNYLGNLSELIEYMNPRQISKFVDFLLIEVRTSDINGSILLKIYKYLDLQTQARLFNLGIELILESKKIPNYSWFLDCLQIQNIVLTTEQINGLLEWVTNRPTDEDEAFKRDLDQISILNFLSNRSKELSAEQYNKCYLLLQKFLTSPYNKDADFKSVLKLVPFLSSEQQAFVLHSILKKQHSEIKINQINDFYVSNYESMPNLGHDFYHMLFGYDDYNFNDQVYLTLIINFLNQIPNIHADKFVFGKLLTEVEKENRPKQRSVMEKAIIYYSSQRNYAYQLQQAVQQHMLPELVDVVSGYVMKM